mmetsp:Transcript_16141/g.44883  ORF Transcript_16141/g.44883 Transcript_16141/m.44883 type:complete len:289 (+) Transcript_16141:366-1232(+)
MRPARQGRRHLFWARTRVALLFGRVGHVHQLFGALPPADAARRGSLAERAERAADAGPDQDKFDVAADTVRRRPGHRGESRAASRGVQQPGDARQRGARRVRAARGRPAGGRGRAFGRACADGSTAQAGPVRPRRALPAGTAHQGVVGRPAGQVPQGRGPADRAQHPKSLRPHRREVGRVCLAPDGEYRTARETRAEEAETRAAGVVVEEKLREAREPTGHNSRGAKDHAEQRDRRLVEGYQRRELNLSLFVNIRELTRERARIHVGPRSRFRLVTCPSPPSPARRGC